MHDGNVGQQAGVRLAAGVVLRSVLCRLACVLLVHLTFPAGLGF